MFSSYNTVFSVLCLVTVLNERVALAVPVVISGENSVTLFEEQLQMLSKQVTALMEHRREDLASIENHIAKRMDESAAVMVLKEEMTGLRTELDKIRIPNPNFKPHHHPTSSSVVPVNIPISHNDHITVQWLTAAMAELRKELSEIQGGLNASTSLRMYATVQGEMALHTADIQGLIRAQTAAKGQRERDLLKHAELEREVESLRARERQRGEDFAELKNQLKSTQLDWQQKWNSLAEKTNQELYDGPNNNFNPSRHQRLIKKHIINLEKTTRNLQSNQNKIIEKINKLNKSREINEIATHTSGIEPRLSTLEASRDRADVKLSNLTRQLSNMDKLHLSVLALLENVERVESTVENVIPAFRKEISKTEVQQGEIAAKITELQEEQTNFKSNLWEKFVEVEEKVQILDKASGIQHGKLHDFIMKSESNQLNTTATKTINLVQELETFENSYRDIVNKLPRDCGAVTGSAGIYLISPGNSKPLVVYCENGWTTIQKRYDGSVDFNRNWREYSAGFGNVNGEHWLGNRNLHLLTTNTPHTTNRADSNSDNFDKTGNSNNSDKTNNSDNNSDKADNNSDKTSNFEDSGNSGNYHNSDNCHTELQINMRDIYGKQWQANYGSFSVDDFAAGFKLTVAGYSGNASDALDYQNRMEFSTGDNDRDISNTHCADSYEAGWWFSHCQHANLNGRWSLGLTWFDGSRNEWIAVERSEMRVRRVGEGCVR